MKRQSAKTGERGTAMLAVLILLMVLSVGVTALWRDLHAGLAYQRRLERAEACRQIAEGGLDTAVAKLRANPGYAGERGVALGAGVFDVTVASGGAPGGYRLRAAGRLEDGGVVRAETVLEATLALDAGGAVRAWHVARERR